MKNPYDNSSRSQVNPVQINSNSDRPPTNRVEPENEDSPSGCVKPIEYVVDEPDNSHSTPFENNNNRNPDKESVRAILSQINNSKDFLGTFGTFDDVPDQQAMSEAI